VLSGVEQATRLSAIVAAKSKVIMFRFIDFASLYIKK